VDTERANKNQTGNSALKSALCLLVALIVGSCSLSTRQLFFDIPPPKPEDETKVPKVATTQKTNTAEPGYSRPVFPIDNESERPPIESKSDWEGALELLPKDAKGNPDWVAALENGVVRPRALDPADRNIEWFKLDFFLKAANPKFDAFFPHSAHVKWMGCDSCHPAVFKYRDNEMSMSAIRKGEYCGRCHGKNSVSFPANNCKRCHTNM
jgi:c(7)-type cytochrome triheme protein